jgi:hypothetical protein
LRCRAGHPILGRVTWLPATLRAFALAVLLTVLAAAPAQAVLPAGNLILNPGAEADVGSTDASCGGDLDVTSWDPETGNFSAIQYGTGAFPSTAESAEIGGGSNLFTGGCPTDAVSTGEQTAVVSGAAPEIDAGQVGATLTGYLGGFSSQDDQAKVETFFLGAAGADLGSAGADLAIGPVTAADRGSVTDLLLRSADGSVPVGTRSILTRVTLTRFSGSSNDGYADNLSLTLGGAVPPPVLGTAVNVAPVRGKVFVKLRGRSFVPLDETRQIPAGSLLDTRRGTVRLISARDRRGNTQSGDFAAGVFQVLQSRRSSAKGLTELRLTGSSFARCGTSRGSEAEAAGLSRRTIRRLRSTARGRFRTRGRNSSATVRGTTWETIDRCDGTLTRVRRGKVAVRDFRRRKTVIVPAGRSYLARAPGGGAR